MEAGRGEAVGEIRPLGNACGIVPRLMPKDREHPLWITEEVRILYKRSSAHPVEYAIMLQIHNGDGWETVISVDNSHEGERRDETVDDHHCHVYSKGAKQSAEALPFEVADTNDAMAKAIQWFADEWEELIS